MRLEKCLHKELALHFTVYLVTSTSTDVKRTGIWWRILPNQTCDVESLSGNGCLCWVSHHQLISKMRFPCPNCTHYDTLVHMTVYLRGNYDTLLKECCQWQCVFQYRHHLLMSIYSWSKEEAIVVWKAPSTPLWCKGISLDILVTYHNLTHYTYHCVYSHVTQN